MNIKFVKPGMRVLTIEWDDLILVAKNPGSGQWRTVLSNCPIPSTGRASREIIFTDGTKITAETMADLIVED